MKKSVKYFALWAMVNIGFLSCTDPLTPPDDGGGTVGAHNATGTWDPGAGYNASYSFRNHRYTFDQTTEGKSVVIYLESSETDVSLQVFNRLNQSIAHAYGNRSEQVTLDNLEKGTYTIIAGTYRRGSLSETADYTLNVDGNEKPLQRVLSQSLKASGVFTTGGAGYNYNGSFRNHHYQFDVTEADENSSLDIMLETTGTKGSVMLIDPNGAVLSHAYGNTEETLYTYIDKKGRYEVIVGTYVRDQIDASYKVDIRGQVSNLEQVPAQDTCVSATITNGAGYNNLVSSFNHVYTFEVTEDNSNVDVVMKGNFKQSFALYSPSGDVIGHNYGNTQEDIIRAANKGKYKIVCGTYQQGVSGDYTVCLVGQFTKFKREQ